MTMQELLDQALAITPDDSISIACEVWSHRAMFTKTRRTKVNFRIWSDNLSERFCGETPEMAFAGYRARMLPRTDIPDIGAFPASTSAEEF